MVFGVFDGLHEGHKHFLSAASEICEELMVVVAQDTAACVLKGHAPQESLEARISAIESFNSRFTVFEGDAVAGSWKVFETHAPDVVLLGYDQEAIAQELLIRDIPYICLGAHEPERFKSSILNTQKPEAENES